MSLVLSQNGLERKFREIIRARKKMRMTITENNLLIVIDCKSVRRWDDLKEIGDNFADFINKNFKKFPQSTEIFLLSNKFENGKNQKEWRGIKVFFSPLENDRKWFAMDLWNLNKGDINWADLKGRTFDWKKI